MSIDLGATVTQLQAEHTAMKDMLDMILHTMTMFDNREALLNGEREPCSRLLEIFDSCYEQHHKRKPVIWDRRTNILLNIIYRIQGNPNSSTVALAECQILLDLDLRACSDNEISIFRDALTELEE